MDISDDMGVSKLSAKVFFKVNYSFKIFGNQDKNMKERYQHFSGMCISNNQCLCLV